MGTKRKAGKTWRVSYGGAEMTLDDLTWDELEAIEASTGVPWGLLHPLKDARVAQSLLAILLVRGGKSDEDAREAVRAMTVRQFKDVFDLVDDDRPSYYGDDGLPVNHPNPAPESSTTSS